MVLHRHEPVKSEHVARMQRLSELVGVHRTRPEVADLSAPNRVVKRVERLLDWRLRVPPMDLIEIDCIQSQSIETVVESCSMAFRERPPELGSVSAIWKNPFVATTFSSRRPARAVPRMRSDSPSEYTLAVLPDYIRQLAELARRYRRR